MKKELLFILFVVYFLNIFSSGTNNFTRNSRTTYIAYPQASAFWTGTTDGVAKTEPSLVRAADTEDGWMIFDVSGIPVGTHIDEIIFHGFVNDTSQPNWSITPLTIFPPTASANDIFTDINDEANNPFDCYHFSDEDVTFSTGWKTITLENSATVDLENSLFDEWFGFGIVCRNDDPVHWINFDGWDEVNIPYLEIITYTHIPGGNLSGILTYEDSPYVIDGDVTVQPGDNLDIEPGVKIYFSGDFSLEILGTMNTYFAINDTIVFKSLDELSLWEGIIVGNDVGVIGTLNLENVFVKNAKVGVEVIAGDAQILSTVILKDTVTVRDTTDVGIKISGVSNTTISNCEIDGYKTGIEISNSDASLSTPTVLNTRVRNSTENSRTDENIGISISGFVSATIDSCEIQDYPYGIKYVGNGSSLSSTPTIQNTRVRNSTESARDSTLITGIYIEDLETINIKADSIDNYTTGIEIINNSVSTRIESTPTVLNTRVRNSTESSRTNSYGLKTSGYVSVSVDSCEFEDYQCGIKCENSSGFISTPTVLNTRVRNSTESSRTSTKGIEISGDIAFGIASNQFIGCDSTLICRNGTNTTIQFDHNIVYETAIASGSNALYANNVDTLIIFNNTVYNFDYGLNTVSVNYCSFYNNIFWNVSNPIQSASSTLSVSYSDIDGGYTGTGNIDSDPVFASEENFDFSLQWNSPCIDAGTGTDDPDSTAADMGAIYYHQSGTPSQPTNIVAERNGNNLIISWDESGNTIYYNVYSSDDPYSGWVLEEEKIRQTSWTTDFSSDKKFYRVKAINGLP